MPLSPNDTLANDQYRILRLLEEMSSEFLQNEGYLQSWKVLHDWVEPGDYRSGSHQWLEKQRDPRAPEEELALDLYYPFEE